MRSQQGASVFFCLNIGRSQWQELIKLKNSVLIFEKLRKILLSWNTLVPCVLDADEHTALMRIFVCVWCVHRRLRRRTCCSDGWHKSHSCAESTLSVNERERVSKCSRMNMYHLHALSSAYSAPTLPSTTFILFKCRPLYSHHLLPARCSATSAATTTSARTHSLCKMRFSFSSRLFS